MFSGKTLLITGGTGTFGNAVLSRFLATEIKEIRVFSRDEKKQDDMRKQYAHPKLRFYVGDVRDPASLLDAMRGVDFVFHAAALKQVLELTRFGGHFTLCGRRSPDAEAPIVSGGVQRAACGVGPSGPNSGVFSQRV